MEAEHQRLATNGHKRGHVRDMASTLNKPAFWTQRNAKATVPAALAEGMTTAVPAACASDLGVAAGRQRSHRVGWLERTFWAFRLFSNLLGDSGFLKRRLTFLDVLESVWTFSHFTSLHYGNRW